MTINLNEKQRFKLKKMIRELSRYRGRHTELVTVYIPAGYSITNVINQLADEQGTATNIKSSATRKNVIDALERMIQHLRLFKQTPPNGLAAFSGNVSEREGQSDVQVWSIEPPIPLNQRLYRCDKQFILEPLTDMCETKEVYGLVVMDRRDADIALLKGKAIVPLSSQHSAVPGKTRAGGQSAQRFERLREGAAIDFYKRIAERMKDELFSKRELLKGILVGGPGPTKYDFVEGGYITNDLKKKIIGIKDLSYTGPFGVQELVDRSQDILANEEIAAEKAVMGRFFQMLSKSSGKITYGEAETLKALDKGAVEILLLSEMLDDDFIEQLEERAQALGTEVRIISTDTREGVQLRDMGKIAAILRYEIQ